MHLNIALITYKQPNFLQNITLATSILPYSPHKHRSDPPTNNPIFRPSYILKIPDFIDEIGKNNVKYHSQISLSPLPTPVHAPTLRLKSHHSYALSPATNPIGVSLLVGQC